jgi:hypothetical protein
MPRSTLPPEARDEIKKHGIQETSIEFESADPEESRKENVGRTGENRGNRRGEES